MKKIPPSGKLKGNAMTKATIQEVREYLARFGYEPIKTKDRDEGVLCNPNTGVAYQLLVGDNDTDFSFEEFYIQKMKTGIKLTSPQGACVFGMVIFDDELFSLSRCFGKNQKRHSETAKKLAEAGL